MSLYLLFMWSIVNVYHTVLVKTRIRDISRQKREFFIYHMFHLDNSGDVLYGSPFPVPCLTPGTSELTRCYLFHLLKRYYIQRETELYSIINNILLSRNLGNIKKKKFWSFKKKKMKIANIWSKFTVQNSLRFTKIKENLINGKI